MAAEAVYIILVGTVTKMNRGTIWCDEEIRALIRIWGDGKIQDELDGAKRNKTIFVDIKKSAGTGIQSQLVAMQSENKKSKRRIQGSEGSQ